jgi:hypothetical protein
MSRRAAGVLGAVLIAAAALVLFWRRPAVPEPRSVAGGPTATSSPVSAPHRPPFPLPTPDDRAEVPFQGHSAKQAFEMLRGRHREAKAVRRTSQITWSQRLVLHHLREARLLALSFPEEALALATSSLGSASGDDRSFAVRLLGFLLEQGKKGAEAPLITTALGPDKDLAEEAVLVLYRADRTNTYQSVYWSRAREGMGAALRAMGTWPDAGAAGVLEEIARGAVGDGFPATEIRGNAEESLEQIRVLLSPDWATRVSSALSDPASPDGRWFGWALKVSQSRGLPNRTELLRKRLDLGEAKVAARIASARDEGYDDRVFGDQFLTHPHASSTGDALFDEVLVAYVEAGGELRGQESGRLRMLGYGVDARQRLEELLFTEGR